MELFHLGLNNLSSIDKSKTQISPNIESLLKKKVKKKVIYFFINFVLENSNFSLIEKILINII